jgi:DNA-binding beta-propeller fold protein YncE
LRDTVIAGLTEVGSSVYAETASACDRTPYRGEAVRIDAASHKVLAQWFTEGKSGPYGGAIWGPGGLSAEPGGAALYAATGNAIGKNEAAGFGEHVVRLTAGLKPEAADYPGLEGFDVDFGATPLLYQAPGCPTRLAVMNKSGAFLVYDRGRIGGGARQRIQMGDVDLGDDGNFIGLPAYDPVHKLILVNLTTDSSAGTYRHGLVALKVGADCSLSLAWQRGLVGQATRAVEYPSVPPTVANGVVYVARSNSAKVYALDVTTGAVLWNSGSQIRGGVYAAPTVVDGQLLVGAYDNRIHAFGP